MTERSAFVWNYGCVLKEWIHPVSILTLQDSHWLLGSSGF